MLFAPSRDDRRRAACELFIGSAQPRTETLRNMAGHTVEEFDDEPIILTLNAADNRQFSAVQRNFLQQGSLLGWLQILKQTCIASIAAVSVPFSCSASVL
jgi:hypothetical protein